ncbi:hypothetical protein D3C81_2150980 [compost metagenome]
MPRPKVDSTCPLVRKKSYCVNSACRLSISGCKPTYSRPPHSTSERMNGATLSSNILPCNCDSKARPYEFNTLRINGALFV